MIWAYTAFFAGRVFTLASTMILARLLLPEDFGLVGFALIVLNFVEVIRSFGINEALIYNDERLEDTRDTAFWINTVVGVGQFMAVAALAPLAASLFGSPLAPDVLKVMALAFIFEGVGQAHSALLQKELRFRKRFMPDLISALIKGVFAIALAALGFGVWSLAFSHVVGALVRTAVVWLNAEWRPRFKFFWGRAQSLWNYGVHLLLFNLLAVGLDQADQLVIGVLLGPAQLGYFSIAYKLPDLVTANFSLILTRVLFPIFAKIKDDREKLIQSFLTTTRYTAIVTFAAGFGLFAVAPVLIPVLYGDQWDQAIPLMQVLALLGVGVTLPWAAGDVLKAIGRPDIPTKLLVIEALYTFPLIWGAGALTGLAIAASSANLIASLVAAGIRLWLIARILKFPLGRIFMVFRGPLAGAAVLLLSVQGWYALAVGQPQLVILIGAVACGGIAYVVALALFERATIREAWGMAASLVGRRPAAVPTEL